MVDFETAFKKPFTDLQKLVIGILLSILPIVNWFARGFAMECSGIGKNKRSKKMPEWNNWADYFTKGFFSVIIGLIYALPALIVFLIGAGSMIGSIIRMVFKNMIPFAMSGADNAMMQNLLADRFMDMIPGLIRFLPFLLFSLLLGLAATYLVPMAILFYLKKNKLEEAFQLKKIAKKAFSNDYFLAWILVGLIGAFGGFLLARIPIIGGAAVSFIMQVIGFTLFGEVYSSKS